MPKAIHIDVRKLRESMHLSQPEFARRFGFNLGTLRQWEQGRSSPDGAARTLLVVIQKSPDAVCEAVREAS